MRTTKINRSGIEPGSKSQEEWIDLEATSVVEVTSEDPNFPIESALAATERRGWRAAEQGEQIIRIVFDKPRPLQRIRLEFAETEAVRTQEFTLRWGRKGEPLREIVRQQWNFSPRGSTSEVEDYRVNLDGVSVLELTLRPDLQPDRGLASLAAWRVA
jgi:hypothetical protein